MARDGIRRAVAICMTPHYSPLSIGAYRAQLDEALRAAAVSVDFIESWHTQPRYIAGIAQNVRATFAQCPGDAKVVFTAHSLPISAREPYESQLRETAQLIAQQLCLPHDRWVLCYQSAPRVNAPWLEPKIENIVPQLARAGAKNLVIAPIGFLADHLEVLCDIDIALQEIARAHDVCLIRTPMLNDSDALVCALAELVREHGTRVA
jgi:ferrochelatase